MLTLISCNNQVEVVDSCPEQRNSTGACETFLAELGLDVLTISSITLASNNSNTSYAKVGDVVTLTVTANDSIKQATVTLRDDSVSLTHFGSGVHQATLTMESGHTKGSISISISGLVSSHGVANSTTYTSTTDASSVTFDETITTPTDVALDTPAASPNFNNTPSLDVSGVESDATVRLYTDTCTTLVGSGTTVGSTITITTSTLADGTYTFYADQVDPAGNVSNCSAAYESYENTPPPFISVWQTTAPAESITLPLQAGYTYNFTVDWGDSSGTSTVTSDVDPDKTHVYASAGTYIVTITGTVQAWYFNDGGDRLKILEVTELGDVGWVNLENAFSGCDNLTTFDRGITDQVVDMSYMFYTSALAVPDGSTWDTSNVANISYMFQKASSANPTTTDWNTSSVTNMNSMFRFATSADPDTSGWNTGNITDMSFMFAAASSANPVTTNCNTGEVLTMASMFVGITGDPNVASWNTIKVTDMNRMFQNAASANPDTTLWETGQVLDMESMFQNASSANPEVSGWDVSKVTSFRNMFRASSADPNVSSWNTASAQNMEGMFYGRTTINPDVSGFDMAEVTTIHTMFFNCASANPVVTSWDTSALQNMYRAFYGSGISGPDFSGWDFSLVSNMNETFFGVTLSNTVYSDLLIHIESENGQPGVVLDGGSSLYNIAGGVARAALIADHTWVITDGGAE